MPVHCGQHRTFQAILCGHLASSVPAIYLMTSPRDQAFFLYVMSHHDDMFTKREFSKHVLNSQILYHKAFVYTFVFKWITWRVSQERALRKGSLMTQGHSKTRKQIQSESVSTYLVNRENTKCYLVLLLELPTNLLIYNLGWDEVQGRWQSWLWNQWKRMMGIFNSTFPLRDRSVFLY